MPRVLPGAIHVQSENGAAVQVQMVFGGSATS